MKVNSEVELRHFDAWSGAVDTKNRILEERLDKEFDSLIEDLYPDGINETQLNDILWFESDWVYESLGIKE